MYHRSKNRFLSLLLALVLLTVPVLAAAEELSGHWAETELTWAFDQGMIAGDEAGNLNPDTAVTGAQAVTILARLLKLQEEGSYPGAENTWYAQAAGKAYAAGFLWDGLDLNKPLTRAQSWELLTAAFGLTRAASNDILLSNYTDTDSLSTAQRRAAAELISAGVLNGFAGKLTPQETLTRAQFVALLYRLVHRSAFQLFTDAQVEQADTDTQGELFFSGSVEQIKLTGINADTVTVRSTCLTDFSMEASQINTLALLQQAGQVRTSCDGVDNLILGNARGIFNAGEMEQVQITGAGTTISLSAFRINTLTVSGSNNVIILDSESRIQNLVFTADSSGNRLQMAGHVEVVQLDGQGNILTGGGRAEVVNLLTDDYELSLRFTRSNDLVPEPEPEPKPEPEPVAEPKSNSHLTDPARMAALAATVSGTYTGNYTEAENWDYDTAVKEAFANYHGYTSQTDYLIWVSRASQKVNIFTRQNGLWILDRTYRCGTGSSGTPEGVTYIFGKQTGWFEATYDVYYVVNFYPNTGYAFHSRLYYPGSDQISDPSIGYPVSHGCVRMYTDEVKWIWDNVPVYTTVVIY